jgi:hypothetical protein
MSRGQIHGGLPGSPVHEVDGAGSNPDPVAVDSRRILARSGEVWCLQMGQERRRPIPGISVPVSWLAQAREAGGCAGLAVVPPGVDSFGLPPGDSDSLVAGMEWLRAD